MISCTHPKLLWLYILAHLIYNDPCYAQTNGIGMGPYDIIVYRLEECPNIGEGKIRFSFKLNRIVRKAFSVDSSVNTTIQIDDSLTLMLRYAQFTNGGWKENFFVKEFPRICTAVESLLSDFLEKVRKTGNMTKEEGKCPIHKGSWSSKNLLLDIKVPSIPVFVYSKYRGDISVKKGDKIYGCMRSYIELVPKMNKKRG